MARFPVPPQPRRSTTPVKNFHGVDYTSNPGSVSIEMSPNAPNMIRDVPGKVRKSMGYHKIAKFPDRINGFHQLLKGNKWYGVIHAGTSIYVMDTKVPSEMVEPPAPVFSGMNDARSKSWQFKDKLYIVDGKQLSVFDGETVKPVTAADAYIPTLTISKEPAGGGTDYEALNLLQPKFKELFLSDGKATDYHMTFSGLDDVPLVVEVKDSEGVWQVKNEGSDYTVNRTTGVVKFSSPPPTSPVTGEDNVRITASRTVKGYADKINKCRIGTRFGVNGAADRLFLSGNPDFVNYDWYSGLNDPTYFPDIGYGIVGSSNSAIMGYSLVNNYLATHKDDYEQERNVVLRAGNLVDNTPAFPVTNTMQGPGAIAPWSFAYLGTEPVFLTKLGVYAITPSDINGEKYNQNRSYYANGKLIEEAGLEDAFAFVYKDLYWLCINGVAYILDGLQRVELARSEPFSSRQYACFYRENVPARVMWEMDKTLCFGAPDGAVYAFYTDPTALESYNDDGKPIDAIWDTPDLSGKLFYKNKSFRFLVPQLSAAVATGVDTYGQKRGIWSPLRSDHTKARYFSYEQVVYSKFTYSNDQTNKTLPSKIRMKRLDKARFRFENKELNEPFGLMAWAVEYVENGNYKG